MRINDKNKSMDMEARDINFILPPYVRSYLFHNKNEMPEKIVFPMFASVDVIGADRQPITIPIEWVPPESPVAKEIASDGSAVAEVTPEQEAAIDDKEAETEALKAKMTELTEPPAPTPEDILRQQEEDALAEQGAAEADTVETEEAIPPARAAFAEPSAAPPAPPVPTPKRQPKQPPGGDIGPGSPPSDMHPRDSRDQVRTTRDLMEEPDITEAEEKPFEKEISRGEDGKPVVEDKPDE